MARSKDSSYPSATDSPKLSSKVFRGYGFPELDAKHLAWHLSLPVNIQYFPRPPYKTEHMLPDYDSITCKHCSTTIQVQLVHPRMNPQTLKFYSTVEYLPKAPTRCVCDNLGLWVSSTGLLQVYLKDRDIEAFSVTNGHLDLHRHDSETLKYHIDLPWLTEQRASSPYSKPVREQILVNHINLYTVEETTQHILLPVSSPQEYARYYNIVILGAHSVYFPTGHIYTYKQLRGVFYEPIGSLIGTEDTIIARELFRKVVLTLYEANLKNQFINYLYHTQLPLLLNKVYEARAERLASKLNIQRTSPPESVLESYMLSIKQPLSFYKELNIYSLNRRTIKSPSTYSQDFHSSPWLKLRTPKEHHQIPPESHLVQLSNTRRHLVEYTKARRAIDPLSVLRYAIEYTNYPPVPHLPLNDTLLKLSEPL